MEAEADISTSARVEAEMEVAKEEEKKKVNIRRYSCEFCGIVRSKRSLITSHIHSVHQEEAAKAQVDREREEQMKDEERKRCTECGVWFKKPAHLKQHMLSHSSEHWISYKRTPKCKEAHVWNGPVTGRVDLL